MNGADDTKQADWMHLKIEKDNRADHGTEFPPGNGKKSCMSNASFLKNPVERLPLKSLINTVFFFRIKRIPYPER